MTKKIILFTVFALLFGSQLIAQKYKEQAKLTADSLYLLIVDEPSRFCELEELYSGDTGSPDCGEYNYVEANNIVEPIRNLVTEDNIDKIMPPVETLFGYHIVIPLEKRGTMIRFKHILVVFDKGF